MTGVLPRWMVFDLGGPQMNTKSPESHRVDDFKLKLQPRYDLLPFQC